MYFDKETSDDRYLDEDILNQLDELPGLDPKYNVILIDDNDHTYDYVIEMLVKIFGYTKLKSFEMACEVDYAGRVIVYTSNRTDAEEKKVQILNYGPDWRLERSQYSMRAVLEPIE